jgi:hypothetical protein
MRFGAIWLQIAKNIFADGDQLNSHTLPSADSLILAPILVKADQSLLGLIWVLFNESHSFSLVAPAVKHWGARSVC